MTRLTRRSSGVVVYHSGLEKGFGKIHDAEGTEYFFHATECKGAFPYLVEGTLVTFVIGSTDKGPRAFEVRKNHAPTPAVLEAAEARGNR